MILTTSNVLLGETPSITTGASSDDAANITDPDFSANYTSLSQQKLIVEFGSTGLISYVAVAGIKVKGNGAGTSSVTISDGSTVISTTLLKRDHCIVATFLEQSFTNLKITLTNAAANRAPTVSYIAAGSSLTVPNNGETGGYNRQWLARRLKNKTTVNQSSAPIAIVRKPVQLKGKLNIPNATALFSQGEWQDFLDFSSENLFFINEDPLLPESSYCCYDLSAASASAHGSTRSLNNLSMTFKVFNGL